MGRNYIVSIRKRSRKIGVRTWSSEEKEGRSKSNIGLVIEIKTERTSLEG